MLLVDLRSLLQHGLSMLGCLRWTWFRSVIKQHPNRPTGLATRLAAKPSGLASSSAPRCRNMVGQFDQVAGQNINRRAMGTGFISAMLGLGILVRSDSVSSATDNRIRKRMEKLILGHARPGKCSRNSTRNRPHRASSKAWEYG